MTSTAAYLHLLVAAQEAANDSLSNVNPAAPAAIPSPVKVRPPNILRREKAANDQWYDTEIQCRMVAKRFLTELIQDGQPRMRDSKGSIGRKRVKATFGEFGDLFKMPLFWKTLAEETWACISFSAKRPHEVSTGIRQTFTEMDDDQIRYIAMEYWIALLMISPTPKDTAALYRKKAAFLKQHVAKSDAAVLEAFATADCIADPWQFACLLSVIADRDLPATLTRYPAA